MGFQHLMGQTVQGWLLSSHVIAQLKLNMEEDLALLSKASKVKEFSAARIKFDENCVQKCYDVLNSWSPNFEDNHDIESFSFRVHTTVEVQKDLRVKAVGLEKSSTFVSERIRSNNIPSYDPKRQSKNLLLNECKEKSKNWRQHVLIKADRQFFGRMPILQEKRGMS